MKVMTLMKEGGGVIKETNEVFFVTNKFKVVMSR